MAQAGFCGTCQENVYLNPDGSCPKGHGADVVSNVYEVPAAPVAQPTAYPAPAAYEVPAQGAPPKKKRTGLIIAVVLIALLLLCGCGVGAVILIGASSSDGGSTSKTTTKPKPDPEKAKATAAWTLMRGIVQGDVARIKSAVPAATVAAVPAATWTDFATESKSADVVFESETWAGAVLTAITKSANGRATVTVTPSKPDANSVELRSVMEGRDPVTLTMTVVDEGGTWKVTSMVSPQGTLRFDKDGFLADMGITSP